MKNILVLGHKGMLGQMVCTYFHNKGYGIHTTSYRFNEEQKDLFLAECAKDEYDMVFNCIGRIKQKTDDLNDLLMANATLPLALKEHLRASQILIQPSTDCVFDGNTNQPYTIDEKMNALDAYGWSKRLGETAVLNRPNTILYRVSIIGPDQNKNGKGLLSWFLSNPDSASINGFANHLWNGITTLEWCKQIEALLINKKSEGQFIFEIGGTKEIYTKFQMLNLFQEYYQTNYTIEQIETENAVNRSMQPSLVSPSLEKQLEELIKLEMPSLEP